MLIEMLLDRAVGVVFDTVIENLTIDTQNKVKSLLKGDPAKRAFQKALSEAVAKYAQGERLVYATALTRDGGLLEDKAVLQELAKVLSFSQGSPDTAFIGRLWRDALESPPSWRDFTQEAHMLVAYLESALKETDVFHAVFERQSLDEIATSTNITSMALQDLVKKIQRMMELMEKGYGTLIHHSIQAGPSIRQQFPDFYAYIEEKTRGFIGRKFVFDEVAQFIASNPRGYFIIKGDPGIGKSALSAQLVKQNGYIHFFNIRANGINKASEFLKNICAQLIAVYKLPYTTLPVEPMQDNSFLSKLLIEVSQILGDRKCVIVVDALDEADETTVSKGSNTLYLPSSLPRGVFIIATSRRGDLKLETLIEIKIIEIKQDEPNNTADIRAYLQQHVSSPGLQAYIQRNGIDDELFIEHLVKKSQGNFIYLRLVLPEIEGGAYKDLALDQIPQGLQNYYERHWFRIKEEHRSDWFDHRLPVVLALTVMQKPVSINRIMEYSRVDDKRRVREVLHDFDQFLYKVDIVYDKKLEKCYRWYHASFFDFISEKQDVAEELVDLRKMEEQVADTMWQEWQNLRRKP